MISSVTLQSRLSLPGEQNSVDATDRLRFPAEIPPGGAHQYGYGTQSRTGRAAAAAGLGETQTAWSLPFAPRGLPAETIGSREGYGCERHPMQAPDRTPQPGGEDCEHFVQTTETDHQPQANSAAGGNRPLFAKHTCSGAVATEVNDSSHDFQGDEIRVKLILSNCERASTSR
jgi:hypothetical protein